MNRVAVTPSDAVPPPPLPEPPLPLVRQTVRDLLLSSAAFHSLDPQRRQEIAQAMVKVCHTAVALLQEEIESDKLVAAVQPQAPVPLSRAQAFGSGAPVAFAQSAGSEFSGVSAERVAGTTQAILNAVSFPRFVTDLINGVFKALVDTNQQQMASYVDLIKNVAATTEGFADANLGPELARQWLIERYPASFEIEGGPDKDTAPGDREEEAQEARLRLRDGGSMPSEEALRTDLGLAPGESVPTGDPETVLVPLARRALARQRQQVLATMVMLGLQRIVIESGRLNASMRFHIDTHSAAMEDKASQFDLRNTITASGRYGFGPWGFSATMTNTIGYVSTQKTQTSEEMNTDLDLNSSVELVFRTDYLPLDRLAGTGQRDRIRVNTLNPEAEIKAATEARTAREKRWEASDAARRAALEKSLQPVSQPQPPKPGAPGTVEDAEKARKEAAEKGAKKPEPQKTEKKEAPGGPSAKPPDKAAPGSAATKAPPPPFRK
jgi:hypothetical protein